MEDGDKIRIILWCHDVNITILVFFFSLESSSSLKPAIPLQYAKFIFLKHFVINTITINSIIWVFLLLNDKEAHCNLSVHNLEINFGSTWLSTLGSWWTQWLCLLEMQHHSYLCFCYIRGNVLVKSVVPCLWFLFSWQFVKCSIVNQSIWFKSFSPALHVLFTDHWHWIDCSYFMWTLRLNYRMAVSTRDHFTRLLQVTWDYTKTIIEKLF